MDIQRHWPVPYDVRCTPLCRGDHGSCPIDVNKRAMAAVINLLLSIGAALLPSQTRGKPYLVFWSSTCQMALPRVLDQHRLHDISSPRNPAIETIIWGYSVIYNRVVRFFYRNGFGKWYSYNVDVKTYVSFSQFIGRFGMMFQFMIVSKETYTPLGFSLK